VRSRRSSTQVRRWLRSVHLARSRLSLPDFGSGEGGSRSVIADRPGHGPTPRFANPTTGAQLHPPRA
jgi:hypothetical protein